MNPKEILQALQAGRLNPAEAEKRLKAMSRAGRNNKPVPAAATMTKQKTAKSPATAAEYPPIAIIGMSGRYPEAEDLGQYWENLRQAKNSIREIPPSRWSTDHLFDPHPSQKGKIYCKWLGVLEDIASFDPLFFMITPAEAEAMDPQHRIFLQEAYRAFEDAGYGGEAVAGTKCGVYLGLMSHEYDKMLFRNGDGIQSSTGNSYAIAAGRIAYHLDLKGPALAIDTACSSSLVGTHLACQALNNREIDMALVGGVSLYLTPESYVIMCAAGMLSAEGQCKTFDNTADGFVPGEGAGALILKRLQDAEADGDSIHGVILGSGTNQDGKTNGITAPSVKSQIELERDIYEKYQIDPASISYVEMHGTGTKLGDPIELQALATVFREKKAPQGSCAIGSVKSNIGHTSAAAGVASIQKVLLAMRHKMMAPTLNFSTPNEHFDFSNSPFYVNTELIPWQSEPGAPRRAAVSSFGFSGTNAHLIVQEYDKKQNGEPRRTISVPPSPFLCVLSARSENRLKQQAANLHRFLKARDDLNLIDMAYTLQVGRQAMACRLALPADCRQTLLAGLAAYSAGEPHPGLLLGQVQNNTAKGTDVPCPETGQAPTMKQLNELAAAWLRGGPVNWQQLYNDCQPRRISLPTYPFARQHCWLPAPEEPLTTTPAPAKQLILTKEWQSAELPAVKKTTANGFLILLSTPATRRLAAALLHEMPETRGVEILHGARDEEVLTTDLFEAAAGAALFRQVEEQRAGLPLAGLIDLTAFDKEYEQACHPEAGKIAFLQKLVEEHRQQGFRLLQVTYRLQPHKLPAPSMRGARMAGLYRMLGAEYRKIISSSMDCDQSVQAFKKLGRQIRQEFLAGQSGSITECCYRGGKRYEPRLRPLSDRANLQPAGGLDPTLDPSEVLLITGGSRGIGAAVAEHMVNRGARNLVILGREELPPQNEWPEILHTPKDSSLTEKLRRLHAYTEQGVSLRYANTSLTDEQGLKDLVNTVRQQMGPVTGVIHCAGLMSPDPAFYRKPMEDILAVCQPKMAGLAALHKCLCQEPLNFFVLFSSISSLAPVLASGQSDYAMANAYMDSFALWQAGQGNTPVRAVQWPAWGETGMAAGGLSTPAYARSGLLNLSTAKGLDFLDAVLLSSSPLCLPCTVTDTFTADTLLARQFPEDSPGSAARPTIENHKPAATESGSADMARISQWLRRIFISELKLAEEQILETTPFDEYGIDSIVLTQLVQVIQRDISTPLSPALFLEHNTLAALTAYLAGNHGADFQEKEEGTPVGAKTTLVEPAADEVAVIGMACRLPGAPDKEEFWHLLSSGARAITPVPASRWQPTANRPDFGGWLQEADLFDPDFFNITHEDAAIMDPQARLVLEESLKALADAGYSHKHLFGHKVGVYVGGRSPANPDAPTVLQAPNPILGLGQNYLATNISRFFNFQGPSLVVDTACSSGLTGISFAVDALLGRRIDLALTGAVGLLSSPYAHEMFAARNILNEKGEFHIFDQRASGEVLGEGAGFVLLKRLSEAVRDGNRIYGVVKTVMLNNDGRTLGPGSPNINGQRQVMKDALAASGKNPADIGYLEVNGGGSPVVDGIEIKAISDAYQLQDRSLGSCSMGSIKPNVGHLLLASGMASFIRCLLSLHNKAIPPFLSATEPFAHYDFAGSRLEFCRSLTPWQSEDGRPRTAALNSFPDGGTNCHLIVEEFQPNPGYERRHFPLPPPKLRRRSFPLVNPYPEQPVNPRHVQPIQTVWGHYNEEHI